MTGRQLMMPVHIITAAIAATGVAQASTITSAPAAATTPAFRQLSMLQARRDTIEVHSGTYYENVNKQLNLMGVDRGGMPVGDAGDTAFISMKLVSAENFDDIAHIYLTTEGTYPGYQADLIWFNWTSIEVGVPAGAEVNVLLEVSIPSGESGYKMFYAKLESTKWTPTAMDTGILYII